MASILRSGKFVRYFAGLARNLVFNTHRETEGSVIKHGQALCTTFSHGFATTIQTTDENLDRSIKKLDQEVRRTGRINRQDIDEVLDEIRSHRSASTSQSLLILRCCGNLVPGELPEVRTALVQEIWQTLNNLNVPMDISHYNALLRVYLENEHPFSPTEFLADLDSKGITPNRVTYQRLISRYCQDGDIVGALRILEFMREKQLPINENVFNALMMGHSEAGDIESAVGVLSVMKNSGVEPKADTYATLLCVYAKIGKIDEILTTIDQCETNEIYLLDKDLLDVIYVLSTNGHNDKIDQIIPKLRKSAGYNHDAVNICLRLVNKGQVDAGYKILKTMPIGKRSGGEPAEVGTFFIKQLVKSKCAPEKILQICKELKEEGLNHRSFLVAVETATTSGNMSTALPVLKELHKLEFPIRQHYFWPMICSQAKIGADAVLDVLRSMQSEFNILPNGETIRDYVIPNLKEANYEKIILLLRSAGSSTSTGATACVYDALINSKIKRAATLASTYNIYYQPGLFRRPLINALMETQDYESYISVVRSIYENLPRKQALQSSNEVEDNVDAEIDNNQRQSEVLGEFVLDAVMRLRNDRMAAIEKILSGLVQQGLSISNKHAKQVQEKLGSLLTSEISTMLDKLTTGELQPVPYESKASRQTFADMPPEQLEKMILQKEAKGENAKGLYRSVLMAYMKANNIQKTEELIEKLETTDFVLTSGVYAQLIDLYCNGNNVDKALSIYAKMKAKEPDFVLDDMKVMKVVYELVANERIDEATNFLNENKQAEKAEDERAFGYNSICWRILNLLAEKGNEADVTKMFESMEINNFIEVSNTLLGALVKVHLIKNDVLKALDVFEQLSTKYNCTPFKNELSCRLIQMEDATNLQRLVDLSTNVHGEVNSLYDLVFSFVECGRIRQARKILETPGLNSRPQRINFACERYRRDGNAETLEALVQATRDLNHIDRNEIFYNLLLTYCKDDQKEKALDLWTKIQEEEDVTPTDKFLITLARYLESKGVEVPFIVPSQSPASEPGQKRDVTKTKNVTSAPASPESNSKSKVNKLIISGNLDETLAAINKSNIKLNVTQESALIELMVKEGRLESATEQVKKMLHSNTFPQLGNFRFYLNKIAESGNIAVIEEIGQLLSPELKRNVSYNNRLCNAFVAAGKSVEYVDDMIKKFNDAATIEELKVLEEQFPKGTIPSILETNKDLLARFEKCAIELADKGIYSPINIVWMHYLENGKLEQADLIMKKYLADTPKLMFNHTTKLAIETKNEQMAKNLLNALKDSKVSEGTLGFVHSCIIDIYCLQGKFDKALTSVNDAIKDVCLENIHRTALLRVKNGLEKEGKQFPHTIPAKKKVNAVDTSSSSSSDDEPPVNK